MRSQTQSDRVFLASIVGLVLFGLIMLASASGPLGYDRFGDSYYFLKHQLVQGVVPGLIALFVTSRIPYKKYKQHAFWLLAVSVVLLVLVFIPGIGTDFGTFANSWVQIGAFSFQPSEIVKLTFFLYLAAWLVERSHGDIRDLRAGLVPFLVLLGIITVLMMLQPDFGTLSIIAAVSFIMYFVAGGPLRHLFGLGVLCVGLFAIAIKLSPYRAARLMTFMHPELDPLGVGYQMNQALLAIGSGGVFGRGYGHSLQKFQYLPEVVGDSIFAVMAEELGFVFTLLFVAAFLGMLMRGFSIAQRTSDKFGMYLVIGIITWFGVQAFVNIGAIVGLLPLTGVPLPFMSYGGTALVISLAAAGVVLNVSRE